MTRHSPHAILIGPNATEMIALTNEKSPRKCDPLHKKPRKIVENLNLNTSPTVTGGNPATCSVTVNSNINTKSRRPGGVVTSPLRTTADQETTKTTGKEDEHCLEMEMVSVTDIGTSPETVMKMKSELIEENEIPLLSCKDA